MKHEMLSKIESMISILKPNHDVMLVVQIDSTDDPEYYGYLKYTGHGDDEVFAKDRYGQIYKIVNFDRIKKVLQANDFHAKLEKVSSSKHPKTSDRYVGIELEFISQLSPAEVTIAMVEAGVEDYVEVKDDGSIDTDDDHEFAHEICILVKEVELNDVVKRVCKALRGSSSVNKSCGMHVHVDMRGRNPVSAYKNLFEMQPMLYAMCPKSRRIGEYSLPDTDYEMFDHDARFSRMSRYRGVNRAAYGTHKTLEVRVHAGTLDYKKIVNWARLLIKIADKRTSHYEKAEVKRDMKKAFESLKLEPDLAQYVTERIEKFKTQHDKPNNDIQLVA